MLDFFKRFKLTYAVYNFFHRKELLHNTALFKRYGLHKKYFSPVSSKDFRHINVADNHTANKPALTSTVLFREAGEAGRQSMLQFEENGFMVIRNYLPLQQVHAINEEITRLLQQGKVKAAPNNKIMFAIHHSALLRSIGQDKNLMELLGCLLQGEATLFQSINFTMGSEQHTHSDSIHMTTFPLGGLLGVWLALDDITEENGPLHYYPGSHQLPYYLNADYDNEGNRWMIGKQSYTAYEDMIANRTKALQLEKKVFTAQKGDLLVWHANLFHGGEPHTDKNLTRRSMVLHYFKEGSICYHEITQRPALIRKG